MSLTCMSHAFKCILQCLSKLLEYILKACIMIYQQLLKICFELIGNCSKHVLHLHYEAGRLIIIPSEKYISVIFCLLCFWPTDISSWLRICSQSFIFQWRTLRNDQRCQQHIYFYNLDNFNLFLLQSILFWQVFNKFFTFMRKAFQMHLKSIQNV